MYRCNGVYRVTVFPRSKKPPGEFRRDTRHVLFCTVQGMNDDQIAYATQASECAVLMSPTKEEIKAEILPENFSCGDEFMYLAFDSENAKKLSICMQFESDSKDIKIEFEVKHNYFNNLHDAVENLSPIIIERLVPKQVDIKPLIQISAVPKPSQYTVLHLDDENQFESLKLIASCPNSNPPLLITGSFGTGKTRLLAASTHHFLQEGRLSGQPVRVLVCAHHQASADTFINNYFGVIKNDAKDPWKETVVRVTSMFYHIQNDKYAHMYKDCNEFCRTFQPSGVKYIVIVSTFLTSLRFREIIHPGFFTHILLDEAAQSREPEAVAPLCLANIDTKILLAGDPMQVLVNHLIHYMPLALIYSSCSHSVSLLPFFQF